MNSSATITQDPKNNSCFPFRARCLTNHHVLRRLEGYYEDWTNSLSDDQYRAISDWKNGPKFIEIHAALRGSQVPISPQTLKDVELIQTALRSAPDIPAFINNVFRGENHQRLSFDEAVALVKRGAIKFEKSFFPTTVTENEAFQFADYYHNAVPLFRDCFLRIPCSPLMAHPEEQIVYQINLPQDRSWFKAAYLGNGVGEIIFQSGMSFKYVDAQLVRYIPEEDFLLLNRATPKEWETRLLVTLEPFQYLG